MTPRSKWKQQQYNADIRRPSWEAEMHIALPVQDDEEQHAQVDIVHFEQDNLKQASMFKAGPIMVSAFERDDLPVIGASAKFVSLGTNDEHVNVQLSETCIPLLRKLSSMDVPATGIATSGPSKGSVDITIIPVLPSSQEDEIDMMLSQTFKFDCRLVETDSLAFNNEVIHFLVKKKKSKGNGHDPKTFRSNLLDKLAYAYFTRLNSSKEHLSSQASNFLEMPFKDLFCESLTHLSLSTEFEPLSFKRSTTPLQRFTQSYAFFYFNSHPPDIRAEILGGEHQRCNSFLNCPFIGYESKLPNVKPDPPRKGLTISLLFNKDFTPEQIVTKFYQRSDITDYVQCRASTLTYMLNDVNLTTSEILDFIQSLVQSWTFYDIKDIL